MENNKSKKYINYFQNYSNKTLENYLILFDKFVDKEQNKKEDLDIMMTGVLLPSFVSKDLMRSFIEFLLKDIEEDNKLDESFTNFKDVLEVRFETHYNVHLDMDSNDIWKIFIREFNRVMNYADYFTRR
ncbi:MAG: hypothetical protein ACLFUI_11180 [Halanaerobiales bacterium]